MGGRAELLKPVEIPQVQFLDNGNMPFGLCLPSECGLGMSMDFVDPVLEREVQLDVSVHCSSCGTHRDVVHGPLKGSIIVAAGVFASLCRVVVEVSLLMVLSILFGTGVGLMTGSTPSIISSTKGTLGVSACWVTGVAATTKFALTTTNIPSSS